MKQISFKPKSPKVIKVIKFETRQVISVRIRPAPVIVLCAFCARETAMFPPNEFARISGRTPRQVYRLIENGDFHYIEQSDGSILICENS